MQKIFQKISVPKYSIPYLVDVPWRPSTKRFIVFYFLFFSKVLLTAIIGVPGELSKRVDLL